MKDRVTVEKLYFALEYDENCVNVVQNILQIYPRTCFLWIKEVFCPTITATLTSSMTMTTAASSITTREPNTKTMKMIRGREGRIPFTTYLKMFMQLNRGVLLRHIVDLLIDTDRRIDRRRRRFRREDPLHLHIRRFTGGRGVLLLLRAAVFPRDCDLLPVIDPKCPNLTTTSRRDRSFRPISIPTSSFKSVQTAALLNTTSLLIKGRAREGREVRDGRGEEGRKGGGKKGKIPKKSTLSITKATGIGVDLNSTSILIRTRTRITTSKGCIGTTIRALRTNTRTSTIKTISDTDPRLRPGITKTTTAELRRRCRDTEIKRNSPTFTANSCSRIWKI